MFARFVFFCADFMFMGVFFTCLLVRFDNGLGTRRRHGGLGLRTCDRGAQGDQQSSEYRFQFHDFLS